MYQYTDKVGDLAGYGMVWYHKNWISIILSFAKFRREHEVKLDSDNGNKFEAKKKDSRWKVNTFKQSSSGLYNYDMKKNCKGITVRKNVE